MPRTPGIRAAVTWALVSAVVAACSGDPAGSDPSAAGGGDSGTGPAELPAPGFHHIHINSVDPERALDWWSTFWPAGERTTVAGLQAFAADGIYLPGLSGP